MITPKPWIVKQLPTEEQERSGEMPSEPEKPAVIKKPIAPPKPQKKVFPKWIVYTGFGLLAVYVIAQMRK